MIKTIVTLPTLNEAGNISIIIEKIFNIVPETDILVVDDNSSDNTSKIVKSHKQYNKKLFLIERFENFGRGFAGKDAFIWALKNKYKTIIEMDADLSHDPIYIPALINASHNCDIVIGSRLIKNGIDKRKGFIRNILSHCSNFYVKKILGINDIYDCTSGFRLFKHYVIESINITELNSKGPSIVEEILYKALKKGYIAKEIPIHFEDRNAGSSELNLKKIIETFIYIINLRIKG